MSRSRRAPRRAITWRDSRAFAKAVRAGDESLMIANGEDGLRALELANGMLLAGYSHQEVAIPVDRGKYERMLRKLREGVYSRIATPWC